MLYFDIKALVYNNLVIIVILLIAFIMDFITGVAKAVYKKNVKSDKLKKSAGKALIYFCTVVMACCLQLMFPVFSLNVNNSRYDGFIWVACSYLIITEFLSIQENGRVFSKGVPLLNKFLKKKKEDFDNAEINE